MAMSRTNAPPRLCAIKGWFGIRAFIEADEHVRTVEADRRLAALRVSSSRPRRFGRRVNAGLGDPLPRQNDAEEEPGEALKRGAGDRRFGRGSGARAFCLCRNRKRRVREKGKERAHASERCATANAERARVVNLEKRLARRKTFHD